MLNCDPRDSFVDQYLILMIDFFLAHQKLPTLELNQIYHKIFYSHVSHFDFDII